MRADSFRLTADDGAQIHVYRWLPDDAPRAVFQIAHGLAEHAARYGRLAQALTAHGFAVYAGDHRGHGQTAVAGDHGFFAASDGWRRCVGDLWTLNRRIAANHPGLPIILLGHSMGSLIAMNYAERYPNDIKSLVLSGTGATSGSAIPKPLQFIIRIGSRLIPGVHVKSTLPPDFISRDPEVVKAYVEDPYVYDIITPRLGEQMMTYNTIGYENAGKLTMPTLIQYGTEDTSFSGQIDFFKAVGASDKTIKAYEGFRHEVYNELPQDRARALADLHTWLDNHL